MKVAVCVITFRRPEGLTRLLQGLSQLKFVKNPCVELVIIVVDNDASGPMRHIVQLAQQTCPCEIIYTVEAKQGPASARNRCLDLITAEFTHIAFIDDDEVPQPRWLDELLWTNAAYSSSIVQGPVRSVFPQGAPSWLQRGRFLEFGPYQDGERLTFGYCGNVLIALEVVRSLKLRFEERFNMSGGEDQYFMLKAMRAGYFPVASADAVVEEWIPKNRTTLRHVLMRKYGHGTTLSTISLIEQQSRSARLTRAAKGLARIGLGIIQVPLLLPRGKKGVVQALSNIFFGAGYLAGLSGNLYQAYAYPEARSTKSQ